MYKDNPAYYKLFITDHQALEQACRRLRECYAMQAIREAEGEPQNVLGALISGEIALIEGVLLENGYTQEQFHETKELIKKKI